MNKSMATSALVGIVMVASAACSGDPEPKPEPEPTRSSSAPVNACTVVDPEVIAPLNPRDRDLVNTLLIGDLTYDGCTPGDVYSVSFGIRVVDNGVSLEQRVKQLGDGTSTAVDGLGDGAVRSEKLVEGDPVMIVMGVRRGEHEVILRNDSPGNRDPEVRVTAEQMIEFLEVYVAAIPADFEEQARTVPVGDGCPTEDDPAITTLAGTVQLARGGRVGEDLRCTYLGDELQTVQLSRSPTDSAADFFDQSAAPTTIENALRAAIRAYDRGVDLVVQPTESELIFVTVTSEGGTVDHEAVRTLTEAFVAGSAP